MKKWVLEVCPDAVVKRRSSDKGYIIAREYKICIPVDNDIEYITPSMY